MCLLCILINHMQPHPCAVLVSRVRLVQYHVLVVIWSLHVQLKPRIYCMVDTDVHLLQNHNAYSSIWPGSSAISCIYPEVMLACLVWATIAMREIMVLHTALLQAYSVIWHNMQEKESKDETCPSSRKRGFGGREDKSRGWEKVAQCLSLVSPSSLCMHKCGLMVNHVHIHFSEYQI